MTKLLMHAIGFLTFVAGLYGVLLEYQQTPVSTTRVAIFVALAVVGLVIMGYADEIAAGLKQLGGAVAPYLPWGKKASGGDG